MFVIFLSWLQYQQTVMLIDVFYHCLSVLQNENTKIRSYLTTYYVQTHILKICKGKHKVTEYTKQMWYELLSVPGVSRGDIQPLTLFGDVAAATGLLDSSLSSLDAAEWFRCAWSSPRSSRAMTSVAATSTGVLPRRFDCLALAPRRSNNWTNCHTHHNIHTVSYMGCATWVAALAWQRTTEL